MSKIKFFEQISGYPLIIPESTCPADDLRQILENILDRDDVISTSVELSARLHSDDLHFAVSNLGFILDEREWDFSCDLTSWTDQDLPTDRQQYDFLNYERIGIGPFVEVASSIATNDHLKTKEGIAILQGEDFDPRLWEVAYYKKRPVGMYLARIDESGIGRLDFMAVIDEFQQKGVGTGLHIRAMRMLKLHGATAYSGSINANDTAMLSVLNHSNCVIEEERHLYIK